MESLVPLVAETARYRDHTVLVALKGTPAAAAHRPRGGRRRRPGWPERMRRVVHPGQHRRGRGRTTVRRLAGERSCQSTASGVVGRPTSGGRAPQVGRAERRLSAGRPARARPPRAQVGQHAVVHPRSVPHLRPREARRRAAPGAAAGRLLVDVHRVLEGVARIGRPARRAEHRRRTR
jgi:hypothetical protein